MELAVFSQAFIVTLNNIKLNYNNPGLLQELLTIILL